MLVSVQVTGLSVVVAPTVAGQVGGFGPGPDRLSPVTAVTFSTLPVESTILSPFACFPPAVHEPVTNGQKYWTSRGSLRAFMYSTSGNPASKSAPNPENCWNWDHMFCWVVAAKCTETKSCAPVASLMPFMAAAIALSYTCGAVSPGSLPLAAAFTTCSQYRALRVQAVAIQAAR